MLGVSPTVIATVPEVVGLLVATLFIPSACVLAVVVTSVPRPSPLIEGPPLFSVPSGIQGKLVAQRHTGIDWAAWIAGLVPGYLSVRVGLTRDAIMQAALGWGALVILARQTGGGTGIVIVAFVYVFVTLWALASTAQRRSRDGWAAQLGRLDRVMELSSSSRPSCPRCRLADRTTSGWCGNCTTRLAPGQIPPADARARATLWTERAEDGELAGLCAEHFVTSWDGAGSARNSREPNAAATSVGSRWRATIQVAFVDPSRPELLWTRASWSLHLDGTLVWSAQRIEAHAYVDGQLAQTWLFAPLECTHAS